MDVDIRVIVLIAAAIGLSGCSEVEPSVVPVLSEPFEYSTNVDKFTETNLLKAERVEIRPPLLLRTTFVCQLGSSGEPGNTPRDAYFAVSVRTGEGEAIAPTRTQFKVNERPPFDALWNNDTAQHQGTFIVPYAQILAGGVSAAERYSAAWVAGMKPYIENPFLLTLIEPQGELDFSETHRVGEEALARTATAANRLMIRYALADGSEQDVDINLNDPAIREVLSKCGWNLGAPTWNSSADPMAKRQQSLSPQELQAHSQNILWFTNNARSCHENGERDKCSNALDILGELSGKGICPVGDPGRQVWGRCPDKTET